jgi:uncharacterized protein (TIGR03437 family)
VRADPGAPQENVTIEARSERGSAQTSLMVLSPLTPRLELPAARHARAGARVGFLVAAADWQGNSIPVTVTGVPRGASFDPSTGEFAWSPEEAHAGEVRIAFGATDAAGRITSGSVQIHVIADRPVIAGLRNGAGVDAGGACTPGARMTLLGTFFGDEEPLAGAVGVRVNGELVPVARASAGAVDFVCPRLRAGTPLSVAVEVAGQISGEWHSVMEEVAPGLFSADGSGKGQGLVVHRRGLAALPAFEVDGAAAITGEIVSLYATGLDCAGAPPVLYVGQQIQQAASIGPSAFPGICEVRAAVPQGVSGSRVELYLETVRADAVRVRSNRVSMAVEQ